MRKYFIILICFIWSVGFSQEKLNKGTVAIDAVGKIYSKYIDGFVNISDSITTVTPIAYTTGSPLKLTNDGLGQQQQTTYIPYGVTSLYNSTTNQFDFSQLSLGDEVSIRFNITVTTTANNQEFLFYMLMSIGAYNYIISDGDYSFKTSGTHQVGFVIPLNIGNTQTRDYPAELYFSSDANASLVINGYYITVKRRFY